MSTLVQSAQSLEYIRLPVTAADVTGEPEDITGDNVTIAFVEPGTSLADDTDYVPATWETISGTLYARCLVGPAGDFEPTAGTEYDVYVAIIDNPESPKLFAGRVYFN